jgi:hypothetical protein
MTLLLTAGSNTESKLIRKVTAMPRMSIPT